MTIPPDRLDGQGASFDKGFSRNQAYQRIILGIATNPTTINQEAAGVPVVCTGLFENAITLQIGRTTHIRLPLTGEINESTIMYAPSLAEGWIPLTARPNADYDEYLASADRDFSEIARVGMTFVQDPTKEYMLIDLGAGADIRRLSQLPEYAQAQRKEVIRRRMGLMAGQHLNHERVTANSFYIQVMRGIQRTFGLF
ncbi:MAG TPA: hypothetical protein VF820_01375 [Patescibacteria group bacterium]